MRFSTITATLVSATIPAINALWTPTSGTTWQISLSQNIDATQALTPDVMAYDVDLFGTSVSNIEAFHAKGKKVICYFSAGSYESNRPDSKQFQPSDLGSVMDGWPDETWINVMSSNVRSIMAARIALAASNGCDAVDPDNTDGYNNSNGLGLTEANALDYVTFLAATAKSAGIAIGLKNTGTLVSSVLADVQFAVVEQCHAYKECDIYQPFIAANKPVFSIEYPASSSSKRSKRGAAMVSVASTSLVSTFCANPASGSQDFSVVLKTMDLDQSIQLCPAVTLAAGVTDTTSSVVSGSSASAVVPSASAASAVSSAAATATSALSLTVSRAAATLSAATEAASTATDAASTVTEAASSVTQPAITATRAGNTVTTVAPSVTFTTVTVTVVAPTATAEASTASNNTGAGSPFASMFHWGGHRKQTHDRHVVHGKHDN